eukprot:511413_1
MFLLTASQELISCYTFNTGNQWKLVSGAASFQYFGISSVCSGNCVKITGDSTLQLKNSYSIDASNYQNMHVEFPLDTWEYSSSGDIFYTQVSVNQGTFLEINQIETSASSTNVVADLPVEADGATDVRLQFKTRPSDQTDSAYVDDVCVYGYPYSAPTTYNPTTTSPTTYNPTTTSPTTHQPTTFSPTTTSPTTHQPTTFSPTTNQPSTNQPSTTWPTTNQPSTNEPTTNEPSTNSPTSNYNMPTVTPTLIPTVNPIKDGEWMDTTEYKNDGSDKEANGKKSES